MPRPPPLAGVTPFHLAFQMGHFSLDTLMTSLIAQGQVAAQVAQPPSSKSGRRAGQTRRSARTAGADVDEAAPEPAPLTQAVHEMDPCEVGVRG